VLLRSRSDPIWLGFGGNSVQFTEFIQKNLHLYQFRNNMSLSTAATANFTRGELATALRKVPIRPNLFSPSFQLSAVDLLWTVQGRTRVLVFLGCGWAETVL
jgi:hypothetical protein